MLFAQGIEDTLDLADAVLAQITIDLPLIRKIYGKSDNASSYLGNYVMEALFRLCEKHGKVLYRYDFNEPCKGKDQCDQEAAYAKSLLRSYVDSGKNVLNAYDIAKAFQYARVS